ncbi:hypothetical protein BUALT_Bualt09G0110500 [Buddleja alternifolia]|uniref:RING-type domain-containing protein n=1 Tax=Buddleja alternifolia TaxID=168488 RepID=A0AAV6X3C1_9LAMI|nr:hypothetical protein BUALT_Bualt09G0110500 [Buddleja alternifolia]
MTNTNATANSTAPPPSLVAHPQNSDMSTLTAVLCLIALVTTPMIIYTVFLAIKCPRNPFRRSSAAPKAAKMELICGVKYTKAAEDGRREAEGNSDECPVCLSAFVEGEEIRQLSACKHVFHVACIDMWLYSHSNCPVCRAAVPVKRSRRVPVDRVDDFQQGLPDAAGLI